MPSSSRPRQPLGTLDGPSRTIRVEPLQVPVPAPEPHVEPDPERKREPAPPATPAGAPGNHHRRPAGFAANHRRPAAR
jgi:hypothetical protein